MNSSLNDIGVVDDGYVYEQHERFDNVLSSTDQLGMRKIFPMMLGGYTFQNREHVIAYVNAAIHGDITAAEKIANAKKNIPKVTGTEWTPWAHSIAYAIAKTKILNDADYSTYLSSLEGTIGAAGMDPIWELGQDKSTASRSEPPHHWGMNAWGLALMRLRSELQQRRLEEKSDPKSHPLDDKLKEFLSERSPSGRTYEEYAKAFTLADGSSPWSNYDCLTEFNSTYRMAIRGRTSGIHVTLDNIREWIVSVNPRFLDAYSFVSSLPSMMSVMGDQERDRIAKETLAKDLVSVERCRKCKGPVRAMSSHTRGADEPGVSTLECFSNTCAVRDREGNLIPYRFRETRTIARTLNVPDSGSVATSSNVQ